MFMEKRECKLCSKTFANGRALGGHMRSHMKKLSLPSKPQESRSPSPTLLSFAADSPSSSSSSEDEGDNGLSYVFRGKPKRSIRIVDPEFSFVVDPNGSVIQDRESETETESSKKPSRKRSKRAWKLGSSDDDDDDDDHYCHKKIQQQETVGKVKSNELCKTESWIPEPEPASSISDTTTEEDIAYCLMMLSRDKWKRQKDLKDQYDIAEEDEDKDEDEDAEEDEGDESEGALKALKSRTRGKYTCETCKKVFRSYQALGGHRASHKKIKVEPENHNNNEGTSSSSMLDKKIHECPICFRVFSSGQALGGHKRTHLTGSSSTLPTQTSTKPVENFIDLNLPAPTDEDDISQIDNSGVSDAEFVIDRIRQ
ncbi:zinc finger protein ZAT9-like [Neltuma alba]|uniref:zinc finger protein ZAT9-like n=1 Tax=Neltuma alba TaxID=207710 RepID=UPI0010A4B8C2|nr:zinc finger protein ZAT9-like [Prosopis alba]XP_028763346.1 zinc finger protein ZAT9-like [Prosopis alba]